MCFPGDGRLAFKTQLRKIKVFGMHRVFVFGGRNGGEPPSCLTAVF